jgi:hypothetical protein
VAWNPHAHQSVLCIASLPAELETFLRKIPHGVNFWFWDLGASKEKFGF